ncbi:MAG: indole-3-glycerol phosphate synthase TrpC [Eubacteriales bacterium]|nr:indole-3-glycerol phosphate synthase TrpC [Eubacteriales bacterium]
MILDELVAATQRRIEREKEEISPQEMRRLAQEAAQRQREAGGNGMPEFPFERRLEQKGIHFICEVKKASPSKGLIAPDFPYLEIAREYEAAGADCISVLTEPDYFKGDLRYLREIAAEVEIPVLRKDFTIDEYMIDQAKVSGASVILLICAILDQERLARYLARADALGLSAIVEAHDEDEVRMALEAGARILGVNNRNLKDFTVDIGNSLRLREFAARECAAAKAASAVSAVGSAADGAAGMPLFIAESGIRTGGDVEALRAAGVNGVLIGETLMRAPDKAEQLRLLRGTV